MENQFVKLLYCVLVLHETKLYDFKNLLAFKSVCGKLVMTSVTSLVTELGQ